MSLIAVAALLLSGGTAIAADCLIDPANVPDPPRFADWPAAPGRSAAPAAPVLDSHETRRFRTVPLDGAAAGPNFAAHFTIVVWGCGASCTKAAVVDARSGHVSFPAMQRAISAVQVADPADPGPNSLRFRRDSRPLAVLGAPGEDEAREGVTYLEWTGTALRPLRFGHVMAACGVPALIDTTVSRSQGVQPFLPDAIDTAHRAGRASASPPAERSGQAQAR